MSAAHEGSAGLELDAAWDLICLSPHFDDAALSAGGWLHRRAAAGARVLVITVCAAPPPPGPLSPFAAAHHRRWGAASGEEGAQAARMTAHRRREDEAALARLGVAGMWLEVPDAIYRQAEGVEPPPKPAVSGTRADTPAPEPRGRWLYTDLDALFGALDERERPRVDALARQLAWIRGIGRFSEVLAPLAVGGHVDHRLVRAAAERWRGSRLAYYEDWPYAGDKAALAQQVAGTALRPERLDLATADIEAKVEAIAAYASQISTFWRDEAAMAEEVWERARLLAAASKPGLGMGRALQMQEAPGAERLWRPPTAAPAA